MGGAWLSLGTYIASWASSSLPLFSSLPPLFREENSGREEGAQISLRVRPGTLALHECRSYKATHLTQSVRCLKIDKHARIPYPARKM